MGRKSRYKKYKAVDPFCTGQRKRQLLRRENVFNKAPNKEDFEQKPPKGFIEFMETNQNEAAREKRVKKRTQTEDVANNGRNKKKSKHQRHPWESEEQFLSRVDRLVANIVNREKMDILKSGGDKDEAPKKLTKEKERKMKRIKKKAVEAKKRKEEEQQDYTKAIKNEQMLESLEKEMLKDKVEFGEVAMEPPTLTKVPRKSKDMARPGQRELLLKGLMGTASSSSVTKTSQQVKGANVKKNKSELNSQKKGKKRKDMSASEKVRFDRTRSEIIEAYRKQRNTKRITLPVAGEDAR